MKVIVKWLFNKWYKHSPTCNCGWTMKPLPDRYDRLSWKCVWGKCGWETFQGTSGKLHWWKK